MKTEINKSNLMKRAWSIFRSGDSFYSKSFSLALSRAWEVEKANAEYRRREAKRISEEDMFSAWCQNRASSQLNERRFNPTPEAMESYYRSGVYSGD